MQLATAVLAALVMLCTSIAAQPAATGQPTLTVHGQGRVQAKPDHANLTAEVATRGKTLEAATTAHRERAQRAANALREMKANGIEIERSTFRLDEVRMTPPPGPAPRREEPEFRAVTTFELKTEQLDRIDAAIAAIAATGLFELRNLRFGIGDKNPGIEAARRAAVADARERAATYAQAAGVKLGDIVRIEDTDARGAREISFSAPVMRSVQVTPPEALTVTAQVTIAWRIGAGP
ncbi:MAG: DUF541 domain-containing protein [Alphaproteobacteria bacterium]|nr:DUF541 domain-containing protein [Alphaproteobacteria bacterium]